MSYLVLARKWRPRKFSDVVGQTHVLKALINALDNDRLHHAYLFAGTRGVGKTTLGRILAKSINCEQGVSSTPCGECAACLSIDEGRFVDLIEVDAASRTKVEDTRELLENVQYAPSQGRYKVYLIDEVHMLSNHSFNALLKTLEEPPSHVKFILATTDPQRLPITILSRCLKFNLTTISVDLISTHLAHLLTQEQLPFDPKALPLMSRAAKGSMRDALSLLDQAIAYGGGEIQEAQVRAMLGSIDRGHVSHILQALADNDGQAVLKAVDHLAQHGVDFVHVLDAFLALLHQIAIVQVVPEAMSEEDQEISKLASVMSPQDVQFYYQIGILGSRDLPLASDARSGFEMIVLRMLAFCPGLSDQHEASAGQAAANLPVPAKQAADVMMRSLSANQVAASPRPEQPVPVVSQDSSPPPSADVTPAANAKPGEASWADTVRQLKIAGIVKQLALNCAYQGRERDEITLILQKSHAQLASKTMIERLQGALTEYYQTSIKINLKLGEPQQETPADLDSRLHAERMQDAVALIEADPNVKTMKTMFDAKVDPKSIRLTEK